jgi:hypothetical protein
MGAAGGGVRSLAHKGKAMPAVWASAQTSDGRARYKRCEMLAPG